jgi:HAD superfamily hydrolase (TIGR01549 family)
MDMKQKIKAVSFDADGTLVTSAYADLIWLEVLPEMVSKEWKIAIEDAKAKLYRDYDSIGPQRPEWYDLPYWLKRYRLDASPRVLLQQYKSAVTLYPEVPDVLERLGEVYELVVTSNSSKLFLEITTEALKPYFKHIFSTLSDFGMMKDTESYIAVSERVGVGCRQMAHIGDSLELDYSRARRAGVRAFYLDRLGRRRGRNFVKDLREFAAKLL